MLVLFCGFVHCHRDRHVSLCQLLFGAEYLLLNLTDSKGADIQTCYADELKGCARGEGGLKVGGVGAYIVD